MVRVSCSNSFKVSASKGPISYAISVVTICRHKLMKVTKSKIGRAIFTVIANLYAEPMSDKLWFDESCPVRSSKISWKHRATIDQQITSNSASNKILVDNFFSHLFSFFSHLFIFPTFFREVSPFLFSTFFSGSISISLFPHLFQKSVNQFSEPKPKP